MPKASTSQNKNDQTLVKILDKILANTAVLAVKTQHCHWNVSGHDFLTLHRLFGEQYDELADVIDLLAERIRNLGAPVQGQMKHYLDMADIREMTKIESADKMVKTLRDDHKKLRDLIQKVFPQVEKTGDQVTMDILVQRLTSHEKTIWFLSSLAA